MDRNIYIDIDGYDVQVIKIADLPKLTHFKNFIGDIMRGARNFHYIILDGGYVFSMAKKLYKDFLEYLKKQDLRSNPIIITNSIFSDLNAPGLHMPWLKAKESSFANAKFVGANLSHGDFFNANVYKVDFREADLSYCKFNKAISREADFRGANLRHAVFKDADIRDAKFKGADLEGADLTGAQYEGADFTDTVFEKVMRVSARRPK